jgi:Mce-associated membrane protein
MRPSGLRRAITLALVIAVTGAGLLVLAGRLRAGAPAANRALLDTDATTKVIGDVTDGLTKIFSYAPDDTAATEKAAADVLAGVAAEQYRKLFAQVKQQAPAQRLTLTTRVVRAGVTNLSGGSAHLLVFLDQATARNGRPSGTVAAAQLSVTARLTGGHWRITDLRSS